MIDSCRVLTTVQRREYMLECSENHCKVLDIKNHTSFLFCLSNFVETQKSQEWYNTRASCTSLDNGKHQTSYRTVYPGKHLLHRHIHLMPFHGFLHTGTHESWVGTMDVPGKEEREETGQASFCLWHIQSFTSLEEIAWFSLALCQCSTALVC